MNTSRAPRSRLLKLWWLHLLPLAAACGQSVIAPAAAPVEQPAASGQTGPAALASLASGLRSNLPLIKRGPVALRPHFLVRHIRAEGVQAGPGNPRDTTIESFAPGLLAEIGSYWQLDYTPTWTRYSSEAFRDTVDHTAWLSGQISRDRWTAGVSQTYDHHNLILVETAHQTRQTRHTTGLKGSYRLGQFSVIETTAARSARYSNSLQEAPEWTTSDWIQWTSTNWYRYKRWQRTDIAGGVSLGYDDVRPGADMTFAVPQAQVSWRPTDKVSLSGQAGVEYRHFRMGKGRTLSSPVYSATVSYQPMPTTKLSLEGSRGVSAAYYANEITRGEGWSVRIEQRLLQRFYFEARMSQNDTSYLASRELHEVRRDDRYRSYMARFSSVLLGRTTLSVFYQTGRNYSDATAYRFDASQYGAELSLRF